MILIYTSKNIKHKAESVIHEHGTNNVYQICDDLKIIILDGNLGRINGFLQYYKKEDKYLIHVNKNSKYQEIIIAHELGHYFLHKCLNTFQMENCSLILGDKLEYQADVFATELLLPDYLFTYETPKSQNWSLNQIAASLQLPLSIVEIKIKQMKLLSAELALKY
ncbi:ImmA/IrrE family metallo-endopeptidase [Bacillus amyloliquefaciens]|uniref:ImmA/IrrE family metallo-endopeptidase n=1 Tax=Bacillus amyloliquefaciens TaxID=1390 RepID=UPI0007799AF4|nr:ImmA/IrrE family metallo-endopeptidase [Bacillus amyloliquefaciens]MEC1246661.1 ImmA/IrrE family metallo-endopeptidase [Bacillus amyloliquefaciens]MEC2254552.1 ImmA/IrrE family metallo-endopeptidase [Bacillus amyloliquefaciens]MED0831685.1 ImmA/IrrE family metallo-endopeptidase [Bacillus amyloliquefaciens]MED4497545.1 ImmA/IrrE family metallo-endopeptidase [Bacillus amyloliquefaciens]MED4527423.1 ImmA/IrrE family metallo-endopeptidase [Bacillus amyloliquefaciens]